jgi:hypothetical protein
MDISATERSAYKGTHYMDCIIKLHGQVIGYKRVPVKISGVPVARRNPIRRPAYAAMAKRRWI